jgi:protein-S-isoprenylcysteine O-methyltransferase Ste14
MSLGWKLAPRAILLPVIAAAILFIPAGSLRFWRGWAFLAAFFVPGLFAFVYFLRHDRELVERRMRSREPQTEQKRLMRVGFQLFIASFLLPGLDYRFGWSRRLVGSVPVWLTSISLVMVVCGFLFVWWVLKVNTYAGRTIEVEAGQKVISTGPYAWVRHPMYLGSLVVWTSAPLALGSWVAFPAFALLIPLYVLRLLNEEKVLLVELPGYPEYCSKTLYRLVPLLW